MSDLNTYLKRKATILKQRKAEVDANPGCGISPLKARSHVAGITGIRPVKMGDYIVTTDSGPGLAGHSLGPSSPEMLLGALASCLAHTYVLQAALKNIPLDHVEIEVTGTLDLADAINPTNTQQISINELCWSTDIRSEASVEQLKALDDDVERACAVLNTIKLPNPVKRVK